MTSYPALVPNHAQPLAESKVPRVVSFSRLQCILKAAELRGCGPPDLLTPRSFLGQHLEGYSHDYPGLKLHQ